ncbi:porin [Glaciimonas sp. GG7]
MKSTIVIACVATAMMLCASVRAQSSVTLYGLISDGVGWVNNEGGAKNVKMISGSNQNNRLGFKMTEDIGNGDFAIAQLENGFDITTGKLGQGGRLFGRQAFVGLSSHSLGTVTLGRQYDMFWDYLTPLDAAIAASGLAAHPGDADNLMGSWRYNNAIKYVSPTFNGMNMEALYAFGDAAGTFALNRAFSAGAGYGAGPLKLAAAYVELDRPGAANPTGAVTDDYSGAPFLLFHQSPINGAAGVERQRNYGVGGSYDFGHGLKWSLLGDLIQLSYIDHTNLQLTNYDTSLTYYLTSALMFGASYTYTHGKYGGLDANPHWHTAMLSVDYFLSKTTDVYLFDVVQRVAGPHAVADIYLNAPSTGRSQNLLLAGIRHRF